MLPDELQRACRDSARVAGTETGENVSEPSANTTTLNVSEGRRTFARSPISFFAVSSGKPCIDPDTSSTKMYSRGGTSSAATTCGGSAIEQEEVLVPALIQQQSGGDLLAGQSVAKDEVAIARESLGLGERHLRAPRAGRADNQLMRGRRELLKRHAGRHHAREVELAARRLALRACTEP